MKKTAALVLALLLGSAYTGTTNPKPRKVSKDEPCAKKPAKPVLGASNEKLTPVNDLPESFTWSNVDGVNYLTNLKN
jgi:hypothetical protein